MYQEREMKDSKLSLDKLHRNLVSLKNQSSFLKSYNLVSC